MFQMLMQGKHKNNQQELIGREGRQFKEEGDKYQKKVQAQASLVEFRERSSKKKSFLEKVMFEEHLKSRLYLTHFIVKEKIIF